MPSRKARSVAAVATRRADLSVYGLDAAGTAELDAVTRRIRQQYQRSLDAWIEVGRGLARARDLISDPSAWVSWVQSSFGWSVRHARNFLALAEFVAGQEEDAQPGKSISALRALPPTAVLQVARAPQEVREAVVERLHAGERPSVSQIRALVRSARQRPVGPHDGPSAPYVDLDLPRDQWAEAPREEIPLADGPADDSSFVAPPRPVTATLDDDVVEALADAAKLWCVSPSTAARHLLALADPDSPSVPPPLDYDREAALAGFRPRYITMFSGIEYAVLLGAQDNDWEHGLATSQYDPQDTGQHAATVLAHRLPPGTVPLGDVTMVEPSDLRGAFEVAIAGPPCQSFSRAGRRRGLSDPKGAMSELYFDLAARAPVRVSFSGVGGTPVTVFENVPTLLSGARACNEGGSPCDYDHAEDDFGELLAQVAGLPDDIVIEGRRPNPADPARIGPWPEAGLLVGGSRTVAWRVLASDRWGLPQGRVRLYLIACRRDEVDPLEILHDGPVELSEPIWSRDGYTLFALDNRNRGPAEPIPVEPGALSRLLVRDRAVELAVRARPERCKLPDGTWGADPYRHLLTSHQCLSRARAGNAVPAWLRQALLVAAELGNDYAESELLARLDEADRAEWRRVMETGAVYVGWVSRGGGKLTVAEEVAPTVIRHAGQSKSERPFVVRREVVDGVSRVWARAILAVEAEAIMGVEDPDYTAVPGGEWGRDADQEGPRIMSLGNSLAVPVIRWLCGRITLALRNAISEGRFLPDRRAVGGVRSRFSERLDAAHLRLLRDQGVRGGLDAEPLPVLQQRLALIEATSPDGYRSRQHERLAAAIRRRHATLPRLHGAASAAGKTSKKGKTHKKDKTSIED